MSDQWNVEFRIIKSINRIIHVGSGNQFWATVDDGLNACLQIDDTDGRVRTDVDYLYGENIGPSSQAIGLFLRLDGVEHFYYIAEEIVSK